MKVIVKQGQQGIGEKMSLLKNREQLTGEVITREHIFYEAERRMWNRAIEKYPLAIVFCRTEEDVRNSILWAKEQQVPIRIRSGRHHYAGYSTGNDVLVIDVSCMNGIVVDEVAGSVTIEGGVRNRELYEAVCQKGYPFPGGGCPTVGAVGFALGGGWGYSARFLGLGCDAIEEVTLINYEGKRIIANKTQNADLFWALKGSGGGQFGVVVKMRFKLPAKTEEATLLRLDFSHVTRNMQIDLWKLWQETISSACPEVNFKISFYNSREKGIGVLLIGIYYGGIQKAHEIVAPFIALGEKIDVTVRPMTVLEVNRWIQDAHPDFEHYVSSGRFVKEAFEEEKLHTLLDLINTRPEGSYYTAVSGYGLGGNIRKRNAQEASFAYGESAYILGFQSVWEDNKESYQNQQWFKQKFEIIKQLTVGSFVNFPSEQLDAYREAYYAYNKERLIKVREKYDPYNVFNFEQGL